GHVRLLDGHAALGSAAALRSPTFVGEPYRCVFPPLFPHLRVSSEGFRIGERPSPPLRATSLIRWGHPVGPGARRAGWEVLARAWCPKVQGEDGPVVREGHRRTSAHPWRVTVGDGVGPK